MTEIVTTLFDEGLKRYQAGEDPEVLLPVFQDICDRAPKNSSAWACLAWLYLLLDKPKPALKAAQKSVKLDAASPQARINLALAILDSGEKGVRPHIEIVQQIMTLDADLRQDIEENIQDGLTRKPNWESLQRIQSWLNL